MTTNQNLRIVTPGDPSLSKLANCERCGKEFQSVPLFGRTWTTACDVCWEIIDKEIEAQRAKEEVEARQKLRFQTWADLTPPLYRKSDESRFPAAAWAKISGWRPSGNGRGLIIAGPTGQCKTRMCYALLKRVILETGARCYAINTAQFAAQVRAQFGWEDRSRQSDAISALQAAKSCAVLLLDDLGKESDTPAVEEHLYGLIEFRTSQLRPTLITTNTVGDDMLKMLSGDRGRPLVRRLREFSDAVVIRKG